MISPVVVALLVVTVSCADELIFPSTLKFGVATSSYQIEGAWNVSDKGPHIWDTFVRTRGVSDGSSGDVACDSYHQWRRDIEMVEELGVDFYRFSLSWPRLLPTGFPNQVSEDGVRYYNELIDGLLEKGIQPVVTIYHWELPQNFQDLGGWANPLISDWFADYARVVFSLFGDRVKTWLTINEPIAICEGSYSLASLAPGVHSPDEIGSYLCNKNVLMAHAKAWRIYDEEFRTLYKGEVSYCNNIFWYYEKTPEDAELAELSRQLMFGRYSHPVYSKSGGWPPAIEKIIAENSKDMGYPTSRLPAFTPEEIRLVRGTFDFYGFNFYTSRYVRAQDKAASMGFPFAGSKELGAKYTVEDFPVACNGWLAVDPEGMRQSLLWLKKEYGDLKILITENGYPTCSAEQDLDDQDRVDYYRDHLTAVHKAITVDGVNVTAFTAWSLMDNFEWMDGYRTKFGLYAVNFSDPLRPRTRRQSAVYYSKIIQSREKAPKPEPKKYSSELYMWCSFVAVLAFVVIVCLFFVYKNRSHRRRETEKVENNTPLMNVDEEKNVK